MNFGYLFIGVIITTIIEPLLFVIFGFRSKKFIITSVAINFLTCLALNLLLYYVFRNSGNYYFSILYTLEICTVIIETLVYLIVEPKRYEVIPLTLAANCISYLIGLLYFAMLSNWFDITF